MSQLLFRNWKLAALWAVGISASIGAFFADGGGHEQFEQSAQQIRERRSLDRGPTAIEVEPEPSSEQASGRPVEADAEEQAFGEPMDKAPSEATGQASPAPDPEPGSETG